MTLPSYGADPQTINASNLNGKVDPLATEFNGNIENVNIKAAAGIVASKLNLATVTDNIAHSGTMTHSGIVTMSGKDITEAKGADIASGATTTIWATDGNFAHITGTTTITSFGTAEQAGDCRTIVFDGALTLTHNATSLILPTGANITTAAGDTAIVRAETTANARVIAYLRKDGTALTSTTAATQAQMETATDTTAPVTPGRAQYHPGVAKAWASFNGTGTPAMIVSHNMDSTITDNGVGDYSFTITTDFSTGNYVLVGGGREQAANNGLVVNIKTGTTPTAGGFTLIVETASSGAPVDNSLNTFVIFGDQ